MANRHIRRCPTSLIIREMKIKSTLRCHLTPFREAIIKKNTNNKCWRGCGEKGTFPLCWCQDSCSTFLSLTSGSFHHILTTSDIYIFQASCFSRYKVQKEKSSCHLSSCPYILLNFSSFKEK